MTTIGKKKIYDRIQKMEEYLKYLKDISQNVTDEKQFISDFHFFGLAERYLQLSIQVIIDVVQMIVVEEGFNRPEDNQEAISLLYNKGIMSEKLASSLDGIVGFRNILVHEYGKIDHRKIYDYLRNEMDALDEFKKEVVRYLK